MKVATRGHRAAAGFTLIELVITLTLTVLILVSVFGGLHLAARASDRGAEHSDRLNEVRVVRDWIRRQLAHARPVFITPEPGERMVAFWGEPHRLRFVAPLPAHLGGGGLSLITLAMDDSEAVKQLVVEYRLFHPEMTEDPQAPQRKLLLEPIQEARFRYYGATQPDSPPEWHSRWLETEFLPSLISVTVRFAEDQARDWTTLVVAPLLDGDARKQSVLINDLSHDTAGL